MKSLSIYARLLLALAGGLLLVFLATGYMTQVSTRNAVASSYDLQLVANSRLLWLLVREELDEMRDLGEINIQLNPRILPENVAGLQDFARERAFRVIKHGQVLLNSANAPADSVPPVPCGFSEQHQNGLVWRAYALCQPGDVRVESWEDMTNRSGLLASIRNDVLGSALLALPAIALITVLALRLALRPLRQMRRDLVRQNVEQIEPLATTGLTPELQPLAGALNRMLEKLRHLRQREAEFIDNAAHELRTPLAALQLHAEMIARAPDDAARQEAVDQLGQSARRIAGLLDQLLMLIRVGSMPDERTAVPLQPLVREVITAFLPVAAQRDIELEVSGSEAASLSSNRALLALLLQTVLDNAIKYAPDGSHIGIELMERGIAVCDEGPGIPPAERAEVFSRFYRGKNVLAPGSGLGLSIAAEVASRLGLQIKLLDNPSGRGLRVEILPV